MKICSGQTLADLADATKKAQDSIFGIGASLINMDESCIKPNKKIPGLIIKKVKLIDTFGRIKFKAEAIFL